jgi:WD40 repeat protein
MTRAAVLCAHQAVRSHCCCCCCCCRRGRRFLCLFGAGGEHLHTLGAEGSHSQLQQLTWLGDSEVLACSGDEVTVWSVSQDSYKEVHVFAAAPKAAITHLAASPNGRYIAAAFDGGQLQVWDTQREDTMDPLFNISEGIEAGQVRACVRGLCVCVCVCVSLRSAVRGRWCVRVHVLHT